MTTTEDPSVRISDEVWAELDHSVGVLTRRQRLRSALLAVVVAVVMVAASMAWWYGVHASVNADVSMSEVDRAAHTFDVGVDVYNDSHLAQTVVSAQASGNGLVQYELPVDEGRLNLPLPLTLDGGSGYVNIYLHFRVPDCAAVHLDVPVPLSIRVHRWWGTRTVHPVVQNTVDDSPDRGDENGSSSTTEQTTTADSSTSADDGYWYRRGVEAICDQ